MTKRRITEAKPATASTTQRAVGVMIVDDHELLRDGLRQLISRQPYWKVCGEADSEHQARIRFRELQPDLVIVDLTLRESSGLDLIKWIVDQRPQTRVIVSTMHDERDYGERAMKAGASGYVNKHLPATTILEAIDRVLRGGLFFSEEMTSRLMHSAVSGADPRSDPGDPGRSIVGALSNRELQVFTLIGHGYTTHEIAKKLHISPNTVGTHRERLKGKLDLNSSADLNRQATLWVVQNG
ncbi:Transcriptional regulatory protein DegU [Stieleria neptunia]|uniref:Transcriptional regulatory protein DegU n=1 Tax=Stieleria neptunia TaxID=2527979 RepID=A0A518I2K8_9BACT|nr:response regulator transcription factor [Stieleria neptunia]QDV47345.1 Transcriptional regulatory protein DegU [Stieleria neptunia]